MPGSSVRDPSPSSSSSGRKGARRRKEKQALTGTTGDSASKKKDKNAKDSGGVVVAVTKHGAKFSNGSPAKEPLSAPETPPSPVQSPEMKPATPASIPTNGSSAAAGSPLLDAVSGTSVATSTAPSTSEWVKHGVMAGSPNLISLMGESPPTQPSSYEDQRVYPHNWTTQRPFANNQAVSASPPTGNKRPLSFQLDAQYPVNDIRSQASSPPGARRSSMHSPFLQARAGIHPPLPHQPQAHFYGAPEIDFDLNPKTGLKAGERGYFFGFDTWPAQNLAYTAGNSNVVLAGYEGGMDVYTVSKRGTELLTSLKGLRGGVYNAKILPWRGISDHYGIYPLVAVVIHGPVLSSSASDLSVETHHDARASPRLDGTSTPQSETNQRPIVARPIANIEAYQTTVEIYSLKTNTLVSTLLQASRIHMKTSITNPAFKCPPSTGAFQIRADDGRIIVSSGVTGECWVYRQFNSDSEPGVEFRCIGKLWTSLQQARREDVTPEDDRSQSPVPSRQTPDTPILTLRGRWLAYCPPAPSSQIALNASIGVNPEGKAPGFNTATSPVLPSETADVDQPASDGVMNRIMRETTQEVIQGARWVGKQGLQLWNNYWKQPGTQSQSRPTSVGSPPWGPNCPGRSDASQFPPTYGVSGQAVTKDPGLVSILDLESLENSASIHHIATFKAPLGCSFLSLSPTGLSLFTASSKGDVQTVWDLMRIQHSKSSALQNSQPNSGYVTRVRQVAQFSRMTVARIVDVAWAKPNGERAAMVTERGTVHLLDMAPSAYSWPPPRRRAIVEDSVSGSAENPPSAVSMASTALSSAYGAARPLISRRRRSASNTQNTSSIMDHASYGGKVLAAGISHSLGNAGSAINQFRQNGENRVSLPMGNTPPGMSCVMWMTGRKSHTLFVAGGGLIRSFPSKTRKRALAKDRQRLPRGNRYKDYKLKNIPDDMIAPAVRQFIDPDEELDLGHPTLHGGSTLVLNTRSRISGSNLGPESSIPQAEIESSAPYQPFHTDRRVALYEYVAEAAVPTLCTVSRLLESTALEESTLSSRKTKKYQHQQQPNAVGKQQAWAFGQSIDAVKVDVGHVSANEDDFTSNSTDDHRALPASAMERVLQIGENDEQIVVTTRRRRGGTRSEFDEDGFFEDDCEVLDFADQRV